VDVTAFIRELLFGHDCVVVPGFGGFVCNYLPARIEKNTGTFYPPVKQISFNRNLNHNDGLLVGRISLSAKINYGDARHMVEEFVSESKRKLEKGERLVFDNIGTFVNNHEGNIQFEPDKSVNYHLDSYGLEPFQCFPLEGYDLRKRISLHVDKDPVKQAALRKILWRAAAVVPFLALIVVVSLKTQLFTGKVETSNMNPLVTAEFENNKKAVDEGTLAESPAIKTESPVTKEESAVIKEKSPEIMKPVATVTETIVPATTETSMYVVITGSFKSKENADSQVDMLKEEGFSPEIVSTDNGFYRVCAISCNDMKTAVSKKDSIVKKFPGTWVSRKK
jgi:nucleoid DNA-binding protein/cell division septation protein DedD